MIPGANECHWPECHADAPTGFCTRHTRNVRTAGYDPETIRRSQIPAMIEAFGKRPCRWPGCENRAIGNHFCGRDRSRVESAGFVAASISDADIPLAVAHHEAAIHRSVRMIEPVQHLLGTIADYALAEMVGCSGDTVARRREALGIAQFTGKRRPPQRRHVVDPVRHLLGTMPDPKVARIAGCSCDTVRAYRQKHGISAWRGGK